MKNASSITQKYEVFAFVVCWWGKHKNTQVILISTNFKRLRNFWFDSWPKEFECVTYSILLFRHLQCQKTGSPIFEFHPLISGQLIDSPYVHLLSKIDSLFNNPSLNCKQSMKIMTISGTQWKLSPTIKWMKYAWPSIDTHEFIRQSNLNFFYWTMFLINLTSNHPSFPKPSGWSCKVCHFILCWSNFWLN